MQSTTRHQESLSLHDQVALTQPDTKGQQAQAVLADMGRFEKLDERVGAAAYLAAPVATRVTGETIRADSGCLPSGI